MELGHGQNPTVGLIVNPVSARDIRRVIANASGLQVTDRTNIVLRALSALAACGVTRVLAMPDRKGVRTLLERSLIRERNLGRPMPEVEFIDMKVAGTVDDTHHAARIMAQRQVQAVIVLGGDGTHRAVAANCGSVPIAGLSTGTNNAYPELRESTVIGMAVGLFTTGVAPSSIALTPNKVIEVSVNDGEITDLALVDVVASTDRYVGARALWKPESLIELFVTFADPEVIGMSAIAGSIQPVGREEPHGLRVGLDPKSDRQVIAPIGPGMIERIGITDWSPMVADEPIDIKSDAGTLALDGERELELGIQDRATATLRTNAFNSINVAQIMRWAATSGVNIIEQVQASGVHK